MSNFETLCNEYRENKRLIEELEALNDTLKASILDLMAGAEVLSIGACKASYKAVVSVRLDTKAIKDEMPTVYDKYSKESIYRRFTVN